MFSRTLLATVISTSILIGGAHASDAVSSHAKIDDFMLQDFRGRAWSLSEFRESRLIVVAFLGVECPIARLYAARLAELANECADQGVAFLGVISNQQDSLTEMAHFARVHEVEFPLLKDLNNVVADRFGAERTPEVFVLDQERQVRYRGRIDDQYYYGLARSQANQEYLNAALKELLANQPVTLPQTEAVGCHIGRVMTPDETAEVTYANQISRLLQVRCVKCHRAGEIAPFALTDYAEVAGWAEMIAEVVHEQRMPPWHANPDHGRFKNDARLTGDEIQLIDQWVAAGAPFGDARDLPEPAVFAEDWQIGEPDEVIYMADEPFQVPAQGDVDYQYFVVDPGWKEDKWIQASECRPGNRAVVHHIYVVVRHPSARLLLPRVGGLSPGMPPQVFPKGAARLVPAGSKPVFELHYTSNGSLQFDRSCVGVVFADPATVKYRIDTHSPYNDEFSIPPGAADYKVELKYAFTREGLLWSFYPHMHLRGRSFRYTALYPDGGREVLLDVPRFDFNWQNIYELAEPKKLPAGTVIHCEAHFDNSENNLANPDPSKTIVWGGQIWDEMMTGHMDVAVVAAETLE